MDKLFTVEHPALDISGTFYRKVFNTEFNPGSHKHSNDLCDICYQYEKGKSAGQVTDAQLDAYNSHIGRKVTARELKDHNTTLTDGAIAVCFDLRQLLATPHLFCGKSYYKRKLNVYNRTFYQLQNQKGSCFTWTSAEANRGANDIATFVIKFLERPDDTGSCNRIILYIIYNIHVY